MRCCCFSTNEDSESDSKDSLSSSCDLKCKCFNFILNMPHTGNDVSDETLEFILSLDTFYPIIERICVYLPIHHLKQLLPKLEKKSPTWAKTISNEIKKRVQFNWATADYEECQVCSNPKDCRLKICKPIKRSQHLFTSNITDLLTFFDCGVLDLMADIQFCKNEIEGIEHKRFYDFLIGDITLYKDIGNARKNASFGIRKLQFHGGDNFNNEEYKMVPFTSLYFPKIPNVEITQFVWFCNKKTLSKDISAENLDCLLIFTEAQSPDSIIKTLLKHLGSLASPINFTLAGACVWTSLRVVEPPELIGQRDLRCIAFKTTNKDDSKFFSASIVIPESVNFEAKVLEFKNNVEIREEQLILAFSCFAKEDKEMEFVHLRQHFTCPITYMDVNGEIGCNHYTVEQRERDVSQSPQVKRRRYDKYHHGYTTILVYLSWGSLKQ